MSPQDHGEGRDRGEGQHQVGDLEIGDNAAFEHRFSIFRHAAHVVLVIILIAGLAGFFGRGLANVTNTADPSRTVRIKYERVARFRTPTMVDVTLGPQALGGQDMRLWVSRKYLDALPMSRVLPIPSEVIPVANGDIFVFHVAPATDSAQVRFFLEPGSIGPQHGEIALLDSKPVAFSQFVAP